MTLILTDEKLCLQQIRSIAAKRTSVDGSKSGRTLGRGYVRLTTRPFLESMNIPLAILRVSVLTSAVICLPMIGHASQVAQALGSAPAPVVVPPRSDDAPQTQPSVKLVWKASTSPGVKYNIYRSGAKGECLKSKSNDCKKINSAPVASTSYTDKTVQAGQSYFYVTRSISSGATESGPSNEAQVTISSPRP